MALPFTPTYFSGRPVKPRINKTSGVGWENPTAAPRAKATGWENPTAPPRVGVLPGWGGILSRMPKGASMTPAGDIGERRQREAVAVGGFKDGETVRASSVFSTFRGGK